MGSSTVQPTTPGALATTASAGLMSSTLIKGGINQLVLLETQVIDWTATGTYAFNDTTGVAPAYPGFYYGVIRVDMTLLTISGTLTTQATWSLGNDPSFINIQASNSSSFATPFGVGAPFAFSLLSGNLTSSPRSVDAANPMKISVTAGASGAGLVFSTKFSMFAMLISHP